MAFWSMKEFGGEIPRKDPRTLPDNMAEQAWNCDLASGPLNGLPTLKPVKDLSAVAGTVRRAYRIPGPNPGDTDAWLALPSEFSSVVKSPLANDSLHRYYWTNPPGSGAPGGWWNTYARVLAGNTGSNAPYNMGFIAPSPALVLTVTPTGGTAPATVPYVARSYLITYIDEHGEESSPSVPSVVVDGASDGFWTVAGLPTASPGNPTGYNYPVVTKIRLYRTVTGQTAGTFYQVVEFPFGGSTYVDTIADTTVVLNNTLASTSWLPPVAALDGLVGFPGGMLMGFSGNTIHFCEPERANAWPAGYDQSLQFNIVGFGVWQNSLVVLTKGFPSTGSGSSPGNFAFSQVQVPEPCISRGSIITDLMGVYYASQNGLVMLNYFGMQNQTLSSFTKEIWLDEYQATNIIACRHRAQYLAVNGTGTGFIIDYTEPRMGVVHISTCEGVVCVWNDPYTGDTYMLADKVVYLWDALDTQSLHYRWRSKQFYLPVPVNLAACQISLETAVEDPPPTWVAPLLDHSDPLLALPNGVNAIFNLYAGPEGKYLIYSKVLDKARMLFRLPSGFKAFDWQVEIVGRVAVHSIELATSMKELRNV